MKKQEVPKIVADDLQIISLLIKDFNKKSKLRLIAKSDDSFLLKVYPEHYETFYFSIDSYEVNLYELTPKYDVSIDFRTIFRINRYYDSINKNQLPTSYPIITTQLEFIFKAYIHVLNDIEATINLSDIFDLEGDEEELISEPNSYESKDKILPYSIKQIFIKDFQGVKETGVDEIPVDTQWIFLVGENGFGKTTVLQAIFLGLHGALDGNINLLEDKDSSIQVEYKSLEDSLINGIKANKNPLTHLAAYGPGRLNVQGIKSENAEDRNNTIAYNLFNSDGYLFNINSELRDLILKGETQRFDLLKKAVCTLIPNLADIRYNKESDQIEYLERELNSENSTATYHPIPFKKLASGFKSIIALAGDMIVRLSKTQPNITNPSELKGIVLIDEIDLHLHPKLQKQLIGQFSTVFPKIQFIVSTHSPIPLLGAPENTLIVKVNRTESEGVSLEKIDIDLKNLTPNLVLTSGIFDMEDFTSVQNEDIHKVRTEDSMTEMLKNDEVKNFLTEFEQSDADFPDELFTPKSQQ
jgi:predicted ATPase